MRIIHDTAGETVTIWFEDPAVEHTVNHPEDGILIMRGRAGRTIGVEVCAFAFTWRGLADCRVRHPARAPASHPRRLAFKVSFELIEGNVGCTLEGRLAILRLLLKNIGLDDVVKLGPRELWLEALDAAEA